MEVMENEWKQNNKKQQFNLMCASKRIGIEWVKRLNTLRFVIKLSVQQPLGDLGNW